MWGIVLTCDRYRITTEYMINQYGKLWDYPFIFRVPYQKTKFIHPKVTNIKTDNEIKSSVMTLLKDLDDEEWVYWCIDDKYPISLDLELYETVYRNLQHCNKIDGILLYRDYKLVRDNHLSSEKIYISGKEFVKRKNYKQIWHHQFLKAKVIRHLFCRFPAIKKAKEMDYYKDRTALPYNLYVSPSNSCFGESARGGKLTANFVKHCFGFEVSKHESLYEFKDQFE